MKSIFLSAKVLLFPAFLFLFLFRLVGDGWFWMICFLVIFSVYLLFFAFKPLIEYNSQGIVVWRLSGATTYGWNQIQAIKTIPFLKLCFIKYSSGKIMILGWLITRNYLSVVKDFFENVEKNDIQVYIDDTTRNCLRPFDASKINKTINGIIFSVFFISVIAITIFIYFWICVFGGMVASGFGGAGTGASSSFSLFDYFVGMIWIPFLFLILFFGMFFLLIRIFKLNESSWKVLIPFILGYMLAWVFIFMIIITFVH
jgi:hypothetical protein